LCIIPQQLGWLILTKSGLIVAVVVKTKEMANPYKIHIEQTILDDLSRRLSLTRWPDELKISGWELGTDKKWLQELCSYWQTGFDWRKQEELLNAFSHFNATVSGTGIHFIQQKSIPLFFNKINHKR